jgi:hypothetical protein
LNNKKSNNPLLKINKKASKFFKFTNVFSYELPKGLNKKWHRVNSIPQTEWFLLHKLMLDKSIKERNSKNSSEVVVSFKLRKHLKKGFSKEPE